MVLASLVTIVGTFIYEQALRAQNMTANITGKNNATMNDSDIISSVPMPLRPPFASEITSG
jgi:hypothetical protein